MTRTNPSPVQLLQCDLNHRQATNPTRYLSTSFDVQLLPLFMGAKPDRLMVYL
jgi:hypothetical protein